jgi:hypothetical protein
MKAAHVHVHGSSGGNGDLTAVREGNIGNSSTQAGSRIEIGVAATVDESRRTRIYMDTCSSQVRAIRPRCQPTGSRIEIGVAAAIDEPWRPRIYMDTRSSQVRAIRSRSQPAGSRIEIGVTAAIDEPWRPRIYMTPARTDVAGISQAGSDGFGSFRRDNGIQVADG